MNKNGNYYVLELEQETDDNRYVYSVAKLDKETEQFYDRHTIACKEKFEQGQEISIKESEICKTKKIGEPDPPNEGKIGGTFCTIELVDGKPNTDVLMVIYNNVNFYKTLAERYQGVNKEKLGQEYASGTHPEILRFCQKRAKEFNPANPYIIAILYQLAEVIGLKVKMPQHAIFQKCIRGFDFPEELDEIIEAMYKIIEDNLSVGLTMNMVIYDGKLLESAYKGEGYISFLKEVEKRTRYFQSDFSCKARQDIFTNNPLEKHGDGIALANLIRVKRTLNITPTETSYIVGNEVKIKFTPNEAKEKYGELVRKPSQK